MGLVAYFNHFERILRFASVATIGEGGNHGWEGDFGKEVRWLDLAESELGVLSTQCLDRRIPDKQASSRKSPPGSKSAMQITPNQTGTSPPKMPALNSRIYTLQSD